MPKLIHFLVVFFGINLLIFPQNTPIPIGSWRSHIDYSKGKTLVQAGSKIYFAAENGLFSYQISNSETEIYADESQLSDSNIGQLAFHESSKILIIYYNSGAIDLAKLDSDYDIDQITSILSIKNSTTILDSKICNEITFKANIAYMATDFGIVQIDILKGKINEIIENIGPNGDHVPINSINFFNGKIYATSNKYLHYATDNESVNLKNFESWSSIILPKSTENSIAKSQIIIWQNELITSISRNGLFVLNNEVLEKKMSILEEIKNINVTNVNLIVCVNSTILLIDNKYSNFQIIEKTEIKKPLKSITIGNFLWIADGSTGLLSNISGDYKKYNPKNTDGIISVRNDSIITDQSGITWAKLTPGNGIKISNKEGKVKIFNRIPLNDNDNSRASNTVNSIAVDKNNSIFIATDAGIVAVNPDPEIINAPNLEAYIITPRIDNARILANENVRSIAIDGGNRKWIGTSTGLFLFNDELNQIIEKFTDVNSPLPSNFVNFLNMDPSQGELFIYTQNGIVSYRTNATEATDNQGNNVLVFPNPVSPSFEGIVGISGLVANAFVKITDISGRLLYKTQANGGTATWNLNTPSGQRAQSGIYFIFSSNEFGKETLVSKLAVIR